MKNDAPPIFDEPPDVLYFPVAGDCTQGAAHYENAAFVCLVFDVSNRDTFESCGRWLQGVRAALPSASTPLPGVLIANKADLREGGINARAVVETKVKTLAPDFLDRLRTLDPAGCCSVVSHCVWSRWQGHMFTHLKHRRWFQ